MIPLLLHLPRVLRSDMRRIYRTEGIRIDLWRHRLRGLRGAELKHHLVDRDSAGGFCSESNRDDAIEIGAEIFAAELIFPEEDRFSVKLLRQLSLIRSRGPRRR
jgi:hypothetical protein